ncbi:MAG: M43 family zinc metalloprotease, partial [Flavobacteriales bacterium]
SQSHEGTIVINRQFGSIGTSFGSQSAIHTLGHETGHFFGLYHTWGLGAIGSACGNDGISDTPPTKGSNSSCNLTQNLCSGIENVQNFMDYSTCACMFTNGQTAYMRAAAASSAGFRSSLSTNGNLIATGTENNHVIYECAPKAFFKAHNDSSFFCIGRTISFDDLSYNDSLSSNRIYEWTFEGGTPSTSTLVNPYVTYNTAGIYDVKLKISNGNGADSLVMSDYIKVFDNISNNALPYFEGFEFSGFPDNSGNGNDWTIVNPGKITKFQRTTVTKKSGTASLVLDLHSESGYDINEMWHYLVSPNIDLSSQSDSVYLDFNFAYAQQKSTNYDLLRIYASADCGQNWALKKNLNYLQLITKGSTTADFVPGISEWSSSNIDLSAYAGNPNFKIMFAMNAKGGNKLYLDNINIYHGGLGIAESAENPVEVIVYPNPIDASSVLEIKSGKPNNFNITILDVLGKQVGSTIQLKNTMQDKLSLGNLLSEFSNGLYYLQVQTGNETESFKIIK